MAKAQAAESLYREVIDRLGRTQLRPHLARARLSERLRLSTVQPGTVDIELVNHLGDAAVRLVVGIEALPPEDIAPDRLPGHP